MSTLHEPEKSNPVAMPSYSVHASAGTGKTYYLVTRIVDCLLAGSAPESILAITFTRKAAAEMQNRVIERLREFLFLSDKELESALAAYSVTMSAELKQHARSLYLSVLLNPYAIRISTFHAFCQEILQRFALDADIPPGSSPTETIHNFREVAWQDLMHTAQTGNDTLLTTSLNLLFEQFSLESVKKLLNNFIANRTNWWAYTDDAPYNQTVSTSIAKLKELYNIEDDTPPLEVFFKDDIIKSQFKLFASLLLKNPTKTNTAFAHDIEQALFVEPPLDGLKNISPAEHDIAHNLIKNVFLTTTGEIRKRSTSKTLESKLGLQAEKFISLHESLAEKLFQLDEKIRCVENIKLVSAWYHVGNVLLENFQKTKREQRTLDFDDLEWITYKLLTQSHQAQWVQYKIETKLSHVLIDEFQDTNQLQWRYLQPVLAELASNQDDKPANTIIVGDVKQSIYSFRRAEPKLFNSASTWLKDNFSAQSRALIASYRSSPAIMNFVNHYFSHIDNIDESFIQHETKRNDLAGAVFLLQANIPEEESSNEEVPSPHRNPLHMPRQQADPSQYYYQAELIASKIETLIDSKLEIKESGVNRPIKYSDIYILFRNRSHVTDFETSLQNHNLPFIGLERGGLLEALEVNDILVLLKWLITPHDNLSLAQVLRSPIFSVSNDDLIMLAEEKQKHTNWFDRLISISQTLPENHIFIHAREKLLRWRKIALQLPVHDLLDTIYSEANILECYRLAFPKHLAPRTTSNLLRLLEISLEVDSGRYPSLQKFLYELQNLRQSSDEMPDSPPLFGVNDRIQLHTIHAAKGLEAPVVFIADMNSAPADRDTYACMVDWPLSQTTPRMILPIFKKSMRDKNMQNLLSLNIQSKTQEDVNLLYVAMTRAAQYLYLVGDSNTQSDTWFQHLVKIYDIDNEENSHGYEKELEAFLPETTKSTYKENIPKETVSPLYDERLTKPITTHPVNHEIAPSYSEDLHYSGHGDKGTKRGLLIHELLNLLTCEKNIYDKEILANPDFFRHRLNIDIDNSMFTSAINEAKSVLQHRDFADFFLPDNFLKSYNEVPICYEHNNKTVNGIIDRLIEFKDKVIIVDYKSHATDKHKMAGIAERYTKQMHYYRNGIQLLWPDKPVETYLLFTAIPHALKITPE